MRNYYGAIAVQGVARPGFGDPQVLHFAYRDAGIRRALWRPYGFVEVAGGEVRLFNYAGLTHVTPRGGRRRFFAETWFGEGAAVFRVASLHDFKLTIASEAGTPRVRFSLPSPLE